MINRNQQKKNLLELFKDEGKSYALLKTISFAYFRVSIFFQTSQGVTDWEST